MTDPLSRRAFLGRSALIGCSLAASPLMTPVTFASAPGDNRLVVIILRGGMDGLDVVRPVGDAGYGALRGVADPGDKPAVELDGFFTMHPKLRVLEPLWRDGDLGFVHAVSTPYRDKRSHFDGQDLLEAGIADLSGGLSRDGWLNRMVGAYPGAGTDTAFALGRDPMAVLTGAAPVARWTPEADLALSPQALRLAKLVMADDPLFTDAMAQAVSIAGSDGDAVAFDGGEGEMMAMMQADQQAARGVALETRIAEFAANRLRKDTRIAAFSINGWDTHERQDKTLPRALGRLAEVILTLKSELGGPVWKKTAIVAMTEFGRTARLNGTGGSDHGTGGAMVLAGGAIRGGRVVADWPGLAEADLYARRDLMPTRDVRAHTGWLLRGLFGIERATLENTIFPGVDLGPDPRLLL